MVDNIHDKLAKSILEHPAEAASYFRAALPPELLDIVDLETLKTIPKSFTSNDMIDRHVDMLFEAELLAAGTSRDEREDGDTADGSKLLLYLLLEHQSGPDLLMPLRMLEYTVAIWRWWLTKKKNQTLKGLPPVLPLVLHQGTQGWTAARSLGELYLGSEAQLAILRPLLPAMDLHIFDLVEVEDSQLPESAAARLSLFVMKHRTAAAADLLRGLTSLAGLFEDVAARLGLRYARLIMLYIAETTSVTEDELSGFAARELGSEIREDFMSAAEELRLQGKAELLASMLRRRFSDVPASVTARLRLATSAELELWSGRILTVATLEEVFAD